MMLFKKATKKELKEYISNLMRLVSDHDLYDTIKREYNQLVLENGYEWQYIRSNAKKEELIIRAESLTTVISINIKGLA